MRILALPLLLAACAPMAMSAGTYPKGPARLGQTVYVGGPTVRPIAVLEDSRCPSGVVCAWAGQVRLRVQVGTGSGKRTMELTSSRPVHTADGTLTLRDVTPNRIYGQDFNPEDYRFTFEFSGGL